MNDGLGALPPAWFAAAALPVVLLDAWLCATIAASALSRCAGGSSGPMAITPAASML